MRQATFFLATIVLPCAVIAVMAARMLVQDRELLVTRLADQRRGLVEDARQALLARLERLRLAVATSEPGSLRHLPPEVVIAAELNGREMVLPWEDPRLRERTAGVSEPSYRNAIADGERQEFTGSNFAAAAAIYSKVAGTASAPGQRLWARVLAARAFAKAGRREDARASARIALDAPASLTDDQGIPYVLYAARLLAQSPPVADQDIAKMVTTMQQALAAPAISPPAVFMMRDAAQMLPAGQRIADAIAARARDMEQALSLRGALPGLGIPLATGETDPTWVTFGPRENLWLVSIGPRNDSRLVTAVRAAPLFASIESSMPVTLTASTDGDLLTPNFPGLRANVAPAALTAAVEQSNRQRPFYLAAIVLVVSVAVFGGALFWRDVRREIRVAEMRSQFVSSVSHELKTPLTAIRMFAETLLMGRAPAEVRHEYLETIVNESERLTRLLNNVLDFSSIESGKKTYRLEPQSVATIARAAAKAIEYPFAQQGFELRLSIEDHLPDVAADADAIQQAILNLLSNAAKYSGDGRIVDLEMKRAGDTVVVAVRDRGLGIAASEHARIFDKYYRVRNDATARVPGTGLGLTVVEHVARAHGGRVTVESAPGRGSTFALVLPAIASPHKSIASEVPA